MREKGYWYYFQTALGRLVNDEGQELYSSVPQAHDEAFEMYPAGPANDGKPYIREEARKRAGGSQSGRVRPDGFTNIRVPKSDEYTAVQQSMMTF